MEGLPPAGHNATSGGSKCTPSHTQRLKVTLTFAQPKEIIIPTNEPSAFKTQDSTTVRRLQNLQEILLNHGVQVFQRTGHLTAARHLYDNTIKEVLGD